MSSGSEAPDRRAAAGLLLLAVCVLAPGLGIRDHMIEAELRLVVIGKDMVETGRLQPPWLEADPVEGRPYLNKPPLAHGLVGLAIAGFGDRPWAARIPSLLAGLLCLWLTFLLAADHGGGAAGFWAGWFLLVSWLFFERSQRSQLELLQTAAVLGCLLALTRARTERPGAARWWGIAALSAGLGALTKGPLLALLFPALWVLAEGIVARSRRPLRWGLLALVGGAAATTLAYYAPLVAEYGAELSERAAGGNAPHQKPPWYYVASLPLDLAPAVLVLPALFRRFPAAARLAPVPLLTFGLSVFVFSVVSSKQDHYLLPVHPLLAVWVGVLLAGARPAERRAALLGPAAAAAACLPLGTLVLGLREPGFLSRNPAVWGVVGFGCVAGTVGLVALLRNNQVTGPAGRGPLVAAVTIALTLGCVHGIYGGYRSEEKSLRPPLSRFGTRVGEAPVAAFDDHLAIPYYLGRSTVDLLADVPAARRFLARPGRFLVLRVRSDSGVPTGLGDFPVVDRWSTPSGRHAWVLLGSRAPGRDPSPGTARPVRDERRGRVTA